jgi:L-alanine-DL-glutamate epimerase-like enolase superfamily enzyme
MAPKMTITGIEAVPLRVPFKAGSKPKASAWVDRNFPAADSLLVKVRTDRGLEGWVEALGFRAVASAKLTIDELISPLCIGLDATPIGCLMVEVQKRLHVFGRSGVLYLTHPAVAPVLWHVGYGHRPLGSCGQAGKHTRVSAPGWRSD